LVRRKEKRMSAFLIELFNRYTSRKFMAAVGGFTLIMLDGVGVAEFSAEVLGIAATGLVAYIGVTGATDTMDRYKK